MHAVCELVELKWWIKIPRLRIYIYIYIYARWCAHAKHKQPKHDFEEISKDCEVEAELLMDVPTTFQVLTQLGEISSSLARSPLCKSKAISIEPVVSALKLFLRRGLAQTLGHAISNLG